MSLKKSVERLQNSRIQVDQFGFHLKDIAGLFYAYEEMDEANREGGMLTLVKGRDKKGLEDIHLVLRDADRNVVYEGNDSHPCPPWAVDHCGGG